MSGSRAQNISNSCADIMPERILSAARLVVLLSIFGLSSPWSWTSSSIRVSSCSRTIPYSLSKMPSPMWAALFATSRSFMRYIRDPVSIIVVVSSVYKKLTSLSISQDPAPPLEFPSSPNQVAQHSNLSIVHGAHTFTPAYTLCAALDSQVLAHPDAVAVQDIRGQQITYEELHTKYIALARRLHALGLRHGDRACLVLDRSIAQIITIFSVLCLGAHYIPLDGALIPDKVLADVIQDACPALVLASRAHVHRQTNIDIAASWYCIEDLVNVDVDDQMSSECFDDLADPCDPAYIIFTSGVLVATQRLKCSASAVLGTTGRSKGVIVSHLNVVNRKPNTSPRARMIYSSDANNAPVVCQSPGNLGISAGVKVAQLLNVGFDMCAWEIFSCLLNGGSLHLRGPRRADWVQVMRAAQVIVCTPSILEQHDPAEYPNVRVVATAGEPCSRALAHRWASRVRFYNCCGPTEVRRS